MPVQVGSENTLHHLIDDLVNFGNQLNALDLTFGNGDTNSTDGLWSRVGVLISPTTITNKVSLGTTILIGSEILRVSGEANIDTIRSANAYLDTTRLRYNTYYANLTSGVLTASRNITLQDKDGTIAYLSDTQSLPNYTLVSTYTQTEVNLALAVTNQHTHSNKTLLDSYNQTNANITLAISYMHQHANKALLDTYNQTNANIASAITNNHTHSNKSLLDTYTQTEVNLADAVSKKHSHTNISALNNLVQSVIDNSHTHTNKTLLDSLITTGTGTLWLDDSGNYSTITEVDPTVPSYVKAITNSQITNWGTAYTDSHTHSNKTLLDSITSSGSATQFLAADGIYRSVSASVGGLDTQVIYNNTGVSAGDSTFTFNNSTKLLTVNSILNDTTSFVDNLTYITKDVSDNLSFTDVVSGTVSLATLLSGATNYWSTMTGGIYYAGSVGINSPATLDEALTVNGNIQATDFNSIYLRYKNSNLLLGPNAGDLETGNRFLYIADSNTATPLIKGDFLAQELTFNADTYINLTKRLSFGSSTVSIRRIVDDMIFTDINANSGTDITLTRLFDGNADMALTTDFVAYSSVTSITAANLVTWNKASVLITSGSASDFLASDGNYYPNSGGVTPTNGILEWVTDKYQPYASYNANTFYLGGIDPTSTTRLNLDYALFATQLFAYVPALVAVQGLSDSNIGMWGASSTYIGVAANSISGNGIETISESGIGIRATTNTGIVAQFENLLGYDNSNPILLINRVGDAAHNYTGDIIDIIDAPVTSGTVSGSLLKYIAGTILRLNFDPRVVDGSTAVAYMLDTHNTLSTAGSKLLDIKNHGASMATFNSTGSMKIFGITSIIFSCKAYLK